MPSQERLWAVLFTVMCLGMAGIHRWKQLDATFVALVFLGALPWCLPWLAPLVKSLKVAGIEFNFRDLQNQIQENKEAIQATTAALASGVGKAPATASTVGLAAQAAVAAAMSFGVPAPSSQPPTAAPADPNKGRFGGKPEAGGRKLWATVKPLAGASEWFAIHVCVTSTDTSRPLRDGTVVTFDLHPSFAQRVARAVVGNGVAALDRVAWGAFTIGAEVDGVKLELDLQDVASAPALFRSR